MKEESLIERFGHLIKKSLTDTSYIEVITAVGDVYANINPDLESMITGLKEANMKIVARTRIELDGDIIQMIPETYSKEDENQAKLLEIHERLVDTGLKNWNDFAISTLHTYKTLVNMAGLSSDDIERNLSAPLAPFKEPV